MILKYFSGKFFAAMSIAIILVLSGVALGVVFGLQSKAGQVVRYLVIGGNEIKTEVVEFMNSGSPPSYGSLPTVRYGAVGAMFGKIPILCGGNDGEGYDFDSCISQWSPSYSMNEKRRDAAGVKINSTMFQILGGDYWSGHSYVYLDSTEFIIEGQTHGIPGPNLPYAMDGMCAVKLSEEEIFVIGGHNTGGERNEVWIYNPKIQLARSQGPSLNTARYAHSCSPMSNGEKTFIIVAGGFNINDKYLDSVEMYDPTDKTWHSGKEMKITLIQFFYSNK